MGKVRSLPNKMELAALTRHQGEYRECRIMVFTETWLTPSNTTLDGFQLMRADRTKESNKRRTVGSAC